MVFTKCKSSLLQLESQPQTRICETNKGLMLNFDDKKKQAQFEKMLTPSSIAAINEILGRVREDQAKVAAQLLQKGVDDEDDDESDEDGESQGQARQLLSSLGVSAKAKQDNVLHTAEEPAATTTTTTL